MKRTNLDELIEQEIKKDPSLESTLNKIGEAFDIAIQIYSLRKQRKFTQAQLASRAHVRQSNIARLENADYEGHSKKTLEKIAKALDVDLKIFFVSKENTPTLNNLLEITNSNKTGQVIFPGFPSGWASCVNLPDQAIVSKDESHEEKVEIIRDGGKLEVSQHLFA